MEKILFSWLDCFLFILMLGVSASIGIYFGFCGKKQDSVDEYILGGKQMKTFPIAMSIVASAISGITLLGVPADVYSYGAAYWLCVISIFIIGAISAFIYLPVFHKLQLTSSYEYLKIRFDNKTRLLASFLFLLSVILYMPIVIYIPALAFTQVTNVNIYLISAIVCIVCIFYTTIGGLKAVVWSDTLQFSVMIVAMLVVLFLGFQATGNIAYIFQKSYEGGRLFLWDVDPDPTKRTSIWSVIIGLTISWLPYFSVSQSCVQKYISLPTLKSAKRSIAIFVIGMFFVKTISVLTGLIIYTKYADCDPLTKQRIQKQDQLLPYFIMDIAGNIRGLPGLFIAGVFCAALSTMSAGLNTFAGVMYEDFIKQLMPKNTSEKRASDIIKCIVVASGAFCTIMVFVVEHLGSILPLSVSVSGMVNGPLLGMFTLGMLVPFANSKGTLIGTISGLLIIGWISIGAQYYIAHGIVLTPKLSTSSICNDISMQEFATNHTISSTSSPLWIYRISSFYYALIGLLVTVLIGSIISLLTGGLKQKVNKDLLSPVIHFTLSEERKYYYTAVEQAMEVMSKNLSIPKDEDT